MKNSFWMGLLLACIGTAQAANGQEAKDAGTPVGSRIPEFEAIDQNGVPRGLASISGPKGAVLVFYRSADW